VTSARRFLAAFEWRSASWPWDPDSALSSQRSPLVSSFFARLKERKLVQWTLAYLAGAWVVLQVMDVAADPLGWPDSVQVGPS
jgi:hypothetical protein